jgi:KTSC domain-containing protein
MNPRYRPDRKQIPKKHVLSTAVWAVGYDEPRGVLQMELMNGAVYDYLDVPRSVYERFMNADSKGGYYNREVRDKYEYFQLREPEKSSAH